MIACLSKNDRGRPVFEELARLDARYQDLGCCEPDRSVLAKGFLSSIQPDIAAAKRDARFSPTYLQAASAECVARLDGAGQPIDAVLYWGATNLPIDPDRHKFPFFVVTDGPFDPADEAYPVEWRPHRWAKSYFESQREVFQQARHVFTLSEWARDKVMRVHELAPEKVSKCGWGPLGCYGPPRLVPAGGSPLFLSVGSEWRRKGMDVVAEAGERIRAEYPDAETIIAGNPIDLDLEPRPGLSLLPVQTPKPVVHALMRQASCLITASRFDASPHVIYEALQYGTPVIGTRTCGVPEAIEEPNGGFVIDRAEPDQLAEAMRRFLNADEGNLRTSAYETFRRAGGWPKAAELIQLKIAEELQLAA